LDAAAPVQAAEPGAAGRGKGGFAGGGGFVGGAMGAGPPPGPGQGFNPNMFNPYVQNGMGNFALQLGQFGGQIGQLGQLGGNTIGNFMNSPNQKYQNMNNDALSIQNAQNNRLTYQELQQRRQLQEQVKGDVRKAGGAIAGLNFKEGIQSVATAEEIGDYFQYLLDQKITLPRQKSAMLPILDQIIDGTKVSIYNEAIHAKYPLLGLKLKNTSGQPLTQGPITVYENSTYAGDTRILDLQPNEERLLSYALDQGTEVKSDIKATPSPEMTFKIGEAQLTARYKLRQTKTYTIKNRSTHDRTVILEHALRGDWKLIDPKKPSEKTRDHYRFTVQVPAGKVVTYDVVEDQSRLDTFALTAGKTPFYAIGLGIEVKQALRRHDEKLTNLKIEKGIVVPTWQIRESKAYYVQNHSDQDRDFIVDHVIRPDWAQLSDKGEKKPGPDVFRFTLQVAKGKTGSHGVDEEKIYTEKGTGLKQLPEAKVREYINNPATSAAVKTGLTRSLELANELADTAKQLSDLEKQLDLLSKDQARLRENLKIIPMTSEHYKKFLEKFVGQETRIETLQNQIQASQAAVQTQERAYEVFVTTLSAD
ncbi:MAG TPA: hypothetical protein VNX28_06670, partial [Gemmataceae bacterium]|nr:hypothetical protein [Gemmataceae bacterium]